MKEIYVVTHTQATHHVDRLVGGWFDSELTEKGRTDAVSCGERLRELGLEGVPITSSDLTRTRQTAAAIAECLGSTVRYDERLREMSFGEAEGRPVDSLPQVLFSCAASDKLDHRSVAGSESRRATASRLYEAMEEIIGSERAIICTHGFATTFLIACWIGMPIESVGRVSFRVRPGSITHLREDDIHGNRALESLGNVSHLRG